MKTALHFLIGILLLATGVTSQAQTLTAGDVIVLGLAADTGINPQGGIDEFSWMPLVNIPKDTKIYFTDAGWFTSTNSFGVTGDTGEFLLKFIAPDIILAGTVMTVTQASTPTGYTFIFNTQCGNAGTVNFPNAGDSVTVFQSNATENSSFPGTNFTAIFAMTSTTTNWASLTATPSTVNPISNLDNVTNLVPGLNSTNSIAVGNGPLESDEADNVRFESPITTGNKAQMLAAITNYANWGRYDTGGNNADLTLPTANGWTANGIANYTITGSDNIVPVVSSITVSGSPAANATSMSFVITFDESVKNVDVSDFNLQTTSGNAAGSVTSVSASTGTSITVTVSSITGAGGLRLRLNANSNIQDAQNNGNGTNGFVAAFNTGSIHNVDRVDPSLTITSSATNPTNLNPIPITFTFSESVTGFDSSDVAVTGGTLGSVSGSGANYTANLTPSSDGTITINVASAKVVDAANNPNTAATQLSRVSDRTAPTVTSMTASVSSPTNSNSFTLTINFSESVLNFVSGDVSATNASLSNLSGSGSSYTILVTPSADGVVSVNIGGSVANDAAGNGNTASSTFNMTVDRVQPTVSISSSAASVTNSNPIPFTVLFSESVTNFDANDISIGNGSISGFTVNSASSYSFNVIPAANGTVTVNVAGAVANDAAGNNNTAATQISRVFDNSSPTVTMSSAASNPTNANSFTLNIAFSESVANFLLGDISVSNANITNLLGSGTTYSVTVTPISDGTVTANIGANVANDAAGNGNSSATQFSIIIDRSQPSVVISSSITGGVTNSNPIPVTVTFNEPVFNFTQSDITLGNGGFSNFTVNSASSYSFNLVPLSNGAVTVNVSSAVANDAAGNSNSAATQFSKTFDNTSPSVSMSSIVPNPTNATTILVSVTFSEAVTGFSETDITPGNASISGFAGSGANYSFNLTPIAPGTVTASIVGGIAIDAAGNGNSAATQFSITYDNSQPSVAISSATASPTNSTSIALTFTFSENVTSFTADDISVVNGSVSNFSGSGTSYNATLIPSAAGTVTVNVSAGTAVDAAGNGNSAATQYSIVYDNSQPTVVISSSATNPTNAASFTVNFTFSESVTNFIATDIASTNAAISNFGGSGTSYSITVTPSGNGLVTIDVPAGVANDLAGNTNAAATQFTIVSDTGGPTVTISTTASNPTNAATIPLTITFTEAVTGFVADDITSLGGSISNFSGSGTTYNATLTPSGDGSITLFIFQNNAVDAAGNGNAFTSFSITSDKTKPTVTISSTSSSPTSNNPIPINFTFSENTTNFTSTDITVTGGSLTNFSGSGASYSVELIPSGNGNKTVKLNAGVMSDAAGNTNNATSIFQIYYLPPCSQTTTWNGLFWSNGDPIPSQPAVIAEDYSSSQYNPGGFSACSLIIGNNATVTINSGDTLTITGNVTVQSGSKLNFETGASLSAGAIASSQAESIIFASGANLMQTGSSNNNAGSITYQRDTTIRRLDYTYWSSPVATQNLKLFSPQTVSPPIGASRFYSYDEPTNAYVVLDPLATSFAPAKGYMIRAGNDLTTVPTLWTGEFKGIPNNGNYSIPVTASNKGFNMLGNPYPSPLDADLFLNANAGTIYFWTHSASGNTNGASNYATYNSSGGVAAVQGSPEPNGTIQAGQGFLLLKSTAGTATFTNSMRINNTDNQFFRTPDNTSKSRIWLNLSSEETAVNQMLLAYIDGATLLEDESMDGKLLAGNSSISSIIGDTNYAIQARPLPFSDTDIVPLNFKATTAGNYAISLDHLDGLFSDQNIYLKDLQAGVTHDIKQGPYNFASLEGSFANRFQIVYQNAILGMENPELAADKVVVYKENQNLKINSGKTIMESIRIFDIRGRLIFEEKAINNSAATVRNLPMEGKVLLIQITSNDKQTVTKKIVY